MGLKAGNWTPSFIPTPGYLVDGRPSYSPSPFPMGLQEYCVREAVREFEAWMRFDVYEWPRPRFDEAGFVIGDDRPIERAPVPVTPMPRPRAPEPAGTR